MHLKQMNVKSKTILLLGFLILFLHTAYVYAVSEAAVLFLLISPSPQANGMGNTYAAAASVDPMASLVNPAYLGYYVQNYNAGFSCSRAGWLPQLVSDMSYQCASVNSGITFKDLPISLGLGWHQIYLDLGENVWTNEMGEELRRFDSWDKAHVLSMAGSWNKLINLSAGLNLKWIHSMLAPDWVFVGEQSGAGSAKATAIDFGVAAKFPIIQSLENISHDPFSAFPHMSFFFTPGMNYSISNIGKEIEYLDAAQADPLPRTAQSGIHFETGLNYKNDHLNLNLVSFTWAREAKDVLIKKNWDANHEKIETSYQSFLGDIDYFNDIIRGKHNANIETKKGWEFSLCETFCIRRGYYEDIAGQVIYATEGWSLNLLQPFRLCLNAFTRQKSENVIDFLIKNGDLNIIYSKYKTETGHPLSKTRFMGVRLQIRNFMEL
ncbi:PorV/PorQ family protein [bacterium]